MHARAICLIKRLETEITVQMTHILSVRGITPAQFTILRFLGNSTIDLSSAQLSRQFYMTPQSMNEVVCTLERKALLERDIDPKHKRILRIRLTEKGQELLDWCNAEMDRLEAIFFEGVDTARMDSFRELIAVALQQRHPITC